MTTHPTDITSATFTGLLLGSATSADASDVEIELYHVFPIDSTNPDGRVIMTAFAQTPESPLFADFRRWILESFQSMEAELDMGSKLYSTFVRAGFPCPRMIAAQPVHCGPEATGYVTRRKYCATSYRPSNAKAL